MSCLPQAIRCWAFSGLLVSSILLLPSRAVLADQVPVRHVEGTLHGFLIIRGENGKELAAGDLIQTVEGDRLTSDLVFHFKDGSIDDETAVFSQHGNFRLLSDHHLQKGPSFPHPLDLSIDVPAGKVTVHFTDGGKEKTDSQHLDLPPDLANGLVYILLRNISPDAPETKVSYLATTPKPRIVKLSIKPQGKERFRVGGVPRTAVRFDIKPEIGGIAGVIAPLVGKQPKDIYIWVLGGKAPAFVRMRGPLYQGGPVWTIELTSPVWPRRSGH